MTNAVRDENQDQNVMGNPITIILFCMLSDQSLSSIYMSHLPQVQF